MSPDDGTTSGPPEVGEALIAALGFEPTSSLTKSPDAEADANEAGKGTGNGHSNTAAADAAAVTGPVSEPAATETETGRDLAPEEWVAKAQTGLSAETGKPAAPTAEVSADAKPLPLLPDFLQSPEEGADGGSSGPPTQEVEATPAVDDPDLPLARTLATDLFADQPAGESAPPPPPVSPPIADPGPPPPSPGTMPPPPYIGDMPGVGAPGSDPAAARTVSAATRTPVAKSGVAERAGDLAARVPQLLEGGLIKRSHRVRARKVRRVVRHIDPWSVLTFSVLFHLCVFASLLLASVLVWNAAVAAGTIENIESFIRELGDYTTYEINGEVVFRAAMVIAGILTLASSVLVVLLTVIFNLISDLVGGIRMTVVEEETVRVRRQPSQVATLSRAEPSGQKPGW